MCFSATASFAAALVTGATGALCLSQMKDRRQVLLAAAPLCFAGQQAIEGLLWVRLAHGPSPATSALTYAFLLIAQVFWPVYAPTAAMLCETDARRRRVMGLCLALGAATSLWLLRGLMTEPHRAVLACDHIVYDVAENSPAGLALGAAYLCAVGLPLLVSSFPSLRTLGGVILAGAVVSYVFYFAAFQSVWCYFAAAASVVILGHFHRLRSERLGQLAPAPRALPGM